MTTQPRKDMALWFFGIVAFLCLSVSIPATLIAMELFHGETWGKPAVVVFEIGAVGAELATIAIPQWRRRLTLLTIVLLVATSGTNYAHGADLFVQASLPGTYAALRAGGYGWLLATIAAGVFPALLFVFLTAFTARWRMLRGGYDAPMKVLAFWLMIFWQYVDIRVRASEQARAELEQKLALTERQLSSYEQQLEQARTLIEQTRGAAEHACALAGQEVERLRREMSNRPAPMEVEIIEVARYRLTYEQLATLSGASVSTIRRRLPELIAR